MEQPQGERETCNVCGADVRNWAEVFNEPHYCPEIERADKATVLKVMSTIRHHGIPYFLPTDILDPELEGLIQGEG